MAWKYALISVSSIFVLFKLLSFDKMFAYVSNNVFFFKKKRFKNKSHFTSTEIGEYTSFLNIFAICTKERTISFHPLM